MEFLEKHFDAALEAPDSIEKLRRLILTIAMQGKLVPQLSKEEPAISFLNQLEGKKKELIKEKKIKKTKAVPKVSNDSIPYSIPSSWEWVTLGNLTSFSMGKTPASKNPVFWTSSKGNSWAAISDLPSRGYLTKTQKQITQSAIEETFKGAAPVPEGTLLMSFKLSIGKTAITTIPTYHNEAIISFHYLNPILKMYLFWILNIAANQGEHKSAIKGKTLNSSSLNAIKIPLPPLKEQERIVAKINKLMMRCDELEQLHAQRDKKRIRVNSVAIKELLSSKDSSSFDHSWNFIRSNFNELYSTKENVGELRKTILQLALMGKLVQQDSSDEPASELLQQIEAKKQQLVKEKNIKKHKMLPAMNKEEMFFDIPETWEWARIEELLFEAPKNGYSPPVANNTTEVRSLTLSATTSGVFNPAHFKYIDEDIPADSDLWLKDGDMLIQRGNTIEYVGVPAIYRGESQQFIYPDLMIRLRFPDALNLEYLYYAMSSEPCRKFLRDRATGTSKTMPKINQKTLKSLPVPIPPLKEQERIVYRIKKLLALCDTLKNTIDATSASQTQLLNSALKKL